MELTVQNVYGLLIRSKLMPLDEARVMYDRWNREAKDAATNVAAFAKWMVANRHVTEYQAALLARGHAEGFYLGQYKVLDRLGKGRMAGVYKAQHDTGPVVAIKVLPPSKARDRALLGRFHRESRVAIKLKHPNIVRTYHVGEVVQPSRERLHYLVMEYIDGEPLDEVLQRRRQFPPAEAVRLVYQALKGLQHLHEQGLVHRDLKPANLMLSYPPGSSTETTLPATVKILDMGLARTLSDETAPDRPEDPQLTSEGILLGTPDYMAPEQARDAHQADIRSDVYSLGCVLYHLLDGRPPFPDTNVISQMIRHATETPRPLKEVNPAVPDGLQQIIGWMMAKDPAQRYPTPERAAQALQVFLSAGTEPPAPEADPRMNKYLTWVEVDSKEKERRDPNRTPAAVAAGVPVAPGTGKMPAAAPAGSARPEGEKKRPRSKSQAAKRKARKARKSALHMKLPVAQAAAPPPVDVELVPLPMAGGPTAPAQAAGGQGLSRRDFVMFGVGIATVIAGAGLGLLGAYFAGAFKKKDLPPEDQ